MKSLLARIQSGEIVVADGAMGTMLMARGLESGKAPEAINVERPEVLEEIARLYIEAGADIVQTNTFGASPLKLAKSNLADKTREINAAGVRAARNAAGNSVFVSASVGPSGRILKPYGDTEPQEVYESFLAQITVLVESGIDALSIETMTDVSEALLALKAAKEASSNIPVIVTMTFEPAAKGFVTIMGTSVARAAKELEAHGADVVGSNCGNGMEQMVRIAREFRACTKLPIIIQPNAGLPQLKGREIVYPETPEFFASKVPELMDAGVSIIGGCCGTTPAHIKAIREVIPKTG